MTVSAIEVSDFSIPTDSRPAVMSITREAHREAVVINSAADAMGLSPQEARDALNAKYSAVMGNSSSRPTRLGLIEHVLNPFVAALPSIVAGREDDEDSRRLLAEIMTIGAGLRMMDFAAIRLESCCDPGHEPVTAKLSVSGMWVVVGEAFLERLQVLARRGGLWLLLADKHLLTELEAENPIGVLNGLAEIQQYVSAVTFKVKLEAQQLKMLQAFFRSA